MDQNEVDDLRIVRFLSGKASEKESQEILEWLNKEHKNRLLYFNCKRVWQGETAKEADETNIDLLWERLKLRIERPVAEHVPSHTKSPILWNFKKIAVAASFLLLAGTTLFLSIQNYRNSLLNDTSNQISVPLGSRSNLVLPDGSNVWLNAGSRLSYNADFGARERIVTLEGEGFFDVTHNSNIPFFVNAGELKIKVLGTRFNVKFYPEEKIIETTLVNGLVEVNPATEDIKVRPVILKPNQVLTYTRAEGDMKISAINKATKEPVITSQPDIKNSAGFRVKTNINPEVYTSWKDGKLIFEGESLADLAPKLERFYNVKISFQCESMKDYKYTGTLQEVTVEELLRAIERTSPITFEINKNQVIFKKSERVRL